MKILLNFSGIGGNAIIGMCNAFKFDGRHGVEAYLRNLKGMIISQHWILEHVGNLSLGGPSSSLVALENVPPPM